MRLLISCLKFTIWANTFVPEITFAFPNLLIILLTDFLLKKSLIVKIPLLLASLQILIAGSTPAIFNLAKEKGVDPSYLLQISNIKSLPKKVRDKLSPREIKQFLEKFNNHCLNVEKIKKKWKTLIITELK